MLKETGRIVAVEDDALWVETIQQSTCGSCSARKGCGQSLLSKIGVNSSYIRVLLADKPSSAYSVGQNVLIGIPNDVVVKGSLFIYLSPLLLMIVLSGLAHTYINLEWVSILLGVLGLVLGGVIIRYHSYRSKNDPRLQPMLLNTEHIANVNQSQILEV